MRTMSHHVGSQVEKKERVDPPKYTVDRETTCPLLLRVFVNTNRHNPMSDYTKGELSRHRTSNKNYQYNIINCKVIASTDFELFALL